MQTTMQLAHRQQQSLAPRLQHAVRLLQLSSLDFSQALQELMQRNPFLEPDEGEPDAPQDLAGPAAAPESAELVGAESMAGDFSADATREAWFADGAAWSRRPDDSPISALDLTPVATTLRDHLHLQLNVLRLPMRDLLLAKMVVEALDDDGYLRQDLADVAAAAALEPAPGADELRLALTRVQALEPAGVGARSVAECLLLQMPAIEPADDRALAETIVSEHLDRLAAKDTNQLARTLRRAPAQIEAVCARIRHLDPHPGWRFDAQSTEYLTPDVIVKRVRGQWTVRLNPAVVPRVRMNQHYARLFQRHRDGQDGELAAHLQEARWTVHNVERRFSTILDVAEAIVKRQRYFFELGPLAMKPLGLRAIADELGLHESTVSRVTNKKYMATPSGVFELKYFFSRAMLARSGGSFSGTAIRELVKDMIDAEAPDAPLSDAQIARLLAQQGLTVARRTVTKYRQLLRIEAVERRRAA